jgi:hypothetical protein
VAAINVGVKATRISLEQLESEFLPLLLEIQAYLADILP